MKECPSEIFDSDRCTDEEGIYGSYYRLGYIARLNSEDFSKFFLCLDTLLLASSDESTNQEVQKYAGIFPNILEYS